MFLTGYRTYALSALGLASTVAYMLGWINHYHWEAAISIFLFGSTSTLRNAVQGVHQKVSLDSLFDAFEKNRMTPKERREFQIRLQAILNDPRMDPFDSTL